MNDTKAETFIKDIGLFSTKLEEVLRFMLLEIITLRENNKAENDRIKNDMDKRTNRLNESIERESENVKKLFAKINEKTDKMFEEVESHIHENNQERREEIKDIKKRLEKENEKRMKEAQILQEKFDKERTQIKEYLENDSLEMKNRLEMEKNSLQEKLHNQANELASKIEKENKSRLKENLDLTQKLEQERLELEKTVKSETEHLKNKMTEVNVKRVQDAEDLKQQLQQEQKAKGNEITQMFDRFKAENESRKIEIHGLKDILIRENDRICKDVENMEAIVAKNLEENRNFVNQKIEEQEKLLQSTEEDLFNALKNEKKEVREKIQLEIDDLKKKVELETNEIRDRIQLDKKILMNNLDEENDEKKREIQLLRSQMSKDKEEIRSQIEADARSLILQLEKDSNTISNLIKKEKQERQFEINLLNEVMEKDRKCSKNELEGLRTETLNKLKKDQDLRKSEEKEANFKRDFELNEVEEKIKELQKKLKLEVDTREMETEEIITALKTDRRISEEKTLKERQIFRDALESEYLELTERLEKLNMQRLDDNADLHSKLSLVAKSASRHIDQLKRYIFRECQSLFDLATKPCSVIFNCHRDDSYFNGGEDYLTFSGCTVNIGNGMHPKSGEFICPETGLYLFLLTCCTYDKKKCLMSLRKNGKDVANLFDQDGDENQGKTMLAQNVLLELVASDKVQVYAYTSTGLTDHKNSNYTQFIGMLLRPSVEAMHEFVCKLGNPNLNEDEVLSICHDNDDVLSVRSTSTLRGCGLYTNGDLNVIRSRRNSRKKRSQERSLSQAKDILVRDPDAMTPRLLSPRLMSPALDVRSRRTPLPL